MQTKVLFLPHSRRAAYFLEFFERHGGSPGDWLEPLDELRREGEQLLDGIRRDAI